MLKSEKRMPRDHGGSSYRDKLPGLGLGEQSAEVGIIKI